MSRYLPVLHVILAVWAITDCVHRRENQFWVFVVLVFPIFGPLLYFAWTRNWLGRALWAMATGRAGRDCDAEIVGEGSPAALQKRGSALVRRGHYKEALESFEKLLEREGPAVPVDARFEIAMAYKAVGRHRDARDQLSMIVGENPKFRTGQAFLELADCYSETQDDAQALTLLEQLLRVVRFPEARYKYAILLDRMGRTDEAAEQMKQMLDELDSAPEFHRKNNRRYAKLARQFLAERKAEG